MKHRWSVTLLLLGLFLASHVFGLLILEQYIAARVVEQGVVQDVTWDALPYGIERPYIEESWSFGAVLLFIALATAVVLLMMHFKLGLLWKTWFFASVWFCLFIALAAWLDAGVAVATSFLLAWWKVIKPHLIVHNVTELLLYGGLAAVFVPFLSVMTVVLLLLVISVYDMIAVWKTKHMVRMATFQTATKVFAGLLVRSDKGKMAVLGGGDIGFPLLLSGAVLKTAGLADALVVSAWFGVALLALLVWSKKDRFYPAMPFLTAGGLVGLFLTFL